MVEFYAVTNAKDLESNIRLQGCPIELKDKVKELVTEYWDVLCKDGFHRPIRGFLFQIDTGKHPLI